MADVPVRSGLQIWLDAYERAGSETQNAASDLHKGIGDFGITIRSQQLCCFKTAGCDQNGSERNGPMLTVANAEQQSEEEIGCRTLDRGIGRQMRSVANGQERHCQNGKKSDPGENANGKLKHLPLIANALAERDSAF